MRLLLTALVLACTGILAGCNGDSSSSSTPNASPTVDFAAVARQVVPGAILTRDDLTEFDSPDAVGLADEAELSAECDVFEPAVVFPDAEATDESLYYVGPDDQQLLNYAAIYRTTEEASAAVIGTRVLVDTCQDEFRATVERIGQDVLDDFGVDLGPFPQIEITILEYDPPPAGDEQIGYRMNATVNLLVTSQEYNLDVIVLRQGRVVSALIYGKFGAASESEETALLEILIPKLEATDNLLPG